MFKLFAMVNITLQKTVPGITIYIIRVHKAFCCMKMMWVICPIIVRAIKHRTVVLGPSNFIKNNS